MKNISKKMLLIAVISLITATAAVAMSAGEKKAKEKELKSLPFLVVDLDGDGIEFIPLEESDVYFDVDGDGLAERTQWVHPDDGFLQIITMEEDRSLNTFGERIVSFFTGGLRKIQNKESGQKEISKSTALFIAQDKDIDGIFETQRKKIIRCSDLILDENSSDNNQLICNNEKFSFHETEFNYEDSNVLWKSMCKQLSLSIGSKMKKEYQESCVDKGYKGE